MALVEAYTKTQGLFGDPGSEAVYTETLTVDLSSIVASIAGPSRPHDRVALGDGPKAFRAALTAAGGNATRPEGVDEASAESFPASDAPAIGTETPPAPPPAGAPVRAPVQSHAASVARLGDAGEVTVGDGTVVIAAITSCTNTSNPQVMVAAGLLARNAVRRGLSTRPWIKTSLAPGSQVVTAYLDAAGLRHPLEALGFYLVGYGCTTCIGNSGPLPGISEAVAAGHLAVSAVLSGNRNFEGRIHPEVKMNWLASPPLVVAYALAGTVDIDLTSDALGTDSNGVPVYLADLWPTSTEVADVVTGALSPAMFTDTYRQVFHSSWEPLQVPAGAVYAWDDDSTYIRRPPFYNDMAAEPSPVTNIDGARVLAVLGDSITTDHISPAGSIAAAGPAGRWLTAAGVDPGSFNSFGARRGNHEVMIRGSFANPRLANRLAAGVDGGFTVHLPDGQGMTIFDAADRYHADGVPLVIVAGKAYGSGSSRDWAAKGTALLGVRAVLAESFERIHRSNLVGMGVLPLELPAGETAASLGLTGRERFSVTGLDALNDGRVRDRVTVTADDKTFEARPRIDTPAELAYYRHGGILPFVARTLARTRKPPP